MRWGDIRLPLPQRLGFFIGLVDRGPQPRLGQAPHAGQQFPRPRNGFSLVVVAEGPIAQHFKERVMIGVTSDLLEVVVFAAYSNALLGIRDTTGGGMTRTEEYFLELVHTRIGEEQGGV